MKIFYRGAEAILQKSGNKITKHRISKGYRHPSLDEKIRKLRTRSESKIMEKASKIIPVPAIISLDEKKKTIKLEYIKGKRLSKILEEISLIAVCRQIGKSLAKLHDAGIIHGDLTTSNLIYNEKEKKVYFIDFGLSFHSNKVEDKAVDLHLIKEALESKHSKIHEKAFKYILEGYMTSKKYNEIIVRLKVVEKRGRYKGKY